MLLWMKKKYTEGSTDSSVPLMVYDIASLFSVSVPDKWSETKNKWKWQKNQSFVVRALKRIFSNIYLEWGIKTLTSIFLSQKTKSK